MVKNLKISLEIEMNVGNKIQPFVRISKTHMIQLCFISVVMGKYKHNVV